VLTLRSTFTAARNNLQKVSGLPVGATPPADQNYKIWLGQAQYARRVLDNGAQFIWRAAWQQTSDRLLPLDRMSIGGIYTVRGYRENELLRDKGRILNVEFDYPLMRQSQQGIGLALIPFYDIGRGQNQTEPADTISSVGLATRLRWHGIRLDLVLAKRLRHPGNVMTSGASLQDHAMHVQLAYDFF
jgi:hemolysin activation/secretion protein